MFYVAVHLAPGQCILVARRRLQRALEAAQAESFDVLLVHRVDRFSSRLAGLLHLLAELDAAGVAFAAATEPFDTSTSIGRMLVPLLGVFAGFERETIIDRVAKGMTAKAATGKRPCGRRPCGPAASGPAATTSTRKHRNRCRTRRSTRTAATGDLPPPRRGTPRRPHGSPTC